MARNTRVLSELGNARPVTGYRQLGSTAAAQIRSTSTPLTKGVRIKIASAQTGTLFISANANLTAGSAPDSSGYPVLPGEEVFFPANDINKVWVRPSESPFNFSFLYY